MKKFFTILLKAVGILIGILVVIAVAGIAIFYFTFGKNSAEFKGKKAEQQFKKDFEELSCNLNDVQTYWHCNGFPCDASIFYRFKTDATCVDSIISTYKLKLNGSFEDSTRASIKFQSFLKRRWWQPSDLKNAKYYDGGDSKNAYYLVFDDSLINVYLFVQNY